MLSKEGTDMVLQAPPNGGRKRGLERAHFEQPYEAASAYLLDASSTLQENVVLQVRPAWTSR